MNPLRLNPSQAIVAAAEKSREERNKETVRNFEKRMWEWSNRDDLGCKEMAILAVLCQRLDPNLGSEGDIAGTYERRENLTD